MKKVIAFIFTALAFVGLAQPQKFNYQGVAVGANGKAIKNASVGLRLSVLDSLPTGSTLYTETQSASTDAAGQFSIYLGAGTATAGTFANIPWANGNEKFLKVEMDAQGGANYQSMGTTPLVSVPFAMVAGSLREGALFYGNNGQKFQLEIDSAGPKWTAIQNFSCGQNVSYAGESYSTIQIGNQCWFSKNLNVGSMINGSGDQTNNAVLEKYCYNNNATNCSTYGGLYQWAEAIQYKNGANNDTFPNSVLDGNVKGICPQGWHIPSSYEWNFLFSYIDSSVGTQIALNPGGLNGGILGFNAGAKLKSISGLWTNFNPANSNSSGFSALPGGVLDFLNQVFDGLGSRTEFWAMNHATIDPTSAHLIRLLELNNNVFHQSDVKKNGKSIRCIKDTLCSNPANAGADQLNITGTIASLSATPFNQGESGSWRIISGDGGQVNSPLSPSAIFSKGPIDTIYSLEWTLNSSCGIAKDTLLITFVSNACSGLSTITYSGQVYPTVQIGNQCWLAKNLNVGTRISGSINQSNNAILEKYCYGNSDGNCTTYGGLYQWAEAVQYQNGATNTTFPNPSFSGFVRGICPVGWHVPSANDWFFMENYLGGSSVAGGKLKSTYNLWTANNSGASNSSGFSALPGGRREVAGNYQFSGSRAFFTTTDSYTTNAAYYMTMVDNNLGTFLNTDLDKRIGFSVRCLKD